MNKFYKVSIALFLFFVLNIAIFLPVKTSASNSLDFISNSMLAAVVGASDIITDRIIDPISNIFIPFFDSNNHTDNFIVIKKEINKQGDTVVFQSTSTSPNISREEILSWVDSFLSSKSQYDPTSLPATVVQNINYIRGGDSQGAVDALSRSFKYVDDRISSINTSASQWTTSGSDIYYNSGNVGIGSSTPGSLLSLGNTGGINFTLATSTFSTIGGINITNGCYAIAGVCISGSVGGGLSTYDAFTHPAVGVSATTTELNVAGLLSTASSTFSSDLRLSSLAQGFSYLGTGGKVNTIASSSINLSWFNNDSGFITSSSIFGKAFEITPAGYLAPTTTVTVLLNNGFISTASSTVVGLLSSNYSSSTVYSSFATASTTNLRIGVVDGCLNIASGLVGSTGSACGSGGGSDPFTHFNGVNSATTTSIAIGTTTQSNYQLTVSSSTAPQLALSMGAGWQQWTARNNAGNLYFSTTTVSGLSSTDLPAFTILSNGNVGVSTTTPTSRFSIQYDWNGSYPAFSIARRGAAPFNNATFSISSGGHLTHDPFVSTNDGLDMVNFGNNRANTNGNFFVINPGSGQQGPLFVVKNGSTDNFIVGGTNNSSNIGISTSTPWRTLSVNGTVAVPSLVNDSTGYYACVNTTTGQLATSTSACGASSERFKENVQNINYGLSEVLKLRPVSFDYKDEYIKDGRHQIGFIAEEVALVVPEVVAYDGASIIQGLDYPKFTAILTKAIQELNSKIQNISTWFIDGKLYVQNDICVDDMCVTKEQFKEILLRSNVGATQIINQTITSPIIQGEGSSVASTTTNIETEAQEGQVDTTSTAMDAEN